MLTKEPFSTNAANNGLFITIYRPGIACTEGELSRIM